MSSPRNMIDAASRRSRRSACLFAAAFLSAALLTACDDSSRSAAEAVSDAAAIAPEPGEDHLADILQLTFEGQNAEAYFGPGDRHIVFQATPDSLGCDQIFTMAIDGSQKRMVSTGRGVTYAIRIDGTGLERITTHPDFDAFPMFDAVGRRLLWASNRNAAEPGDTNIFITSWSEGTTEPRGR